VQNRWAAKISDYIMQNLHWENLSCKSKTIKIHYYQMLLIKKKGGGMYIQHNLQACSDSCILIYLLSIHCPDSNISILKRNNASITSHPLDTFYILQLIDWLITIHEWKQKDHLLIQGLLYTTKLNRPHQIICYVISQSLYTSL
jgi:hypothetical protein